MSIEFVLVAALLVAVTVTLVEIVAAVGIHGELQTAAREGVRVAATDPEPAHAVDRVREVLPPGLADGAEVAVERPESAGALARVRVTVTYHPVTPLLRTFSVDMTASAVMQVEP